MSMDLDSSPIIVKKKKSHNHGGHGGAWKVAYADFVTAMMALFIVLWILSQSDAVKESVAKYFKDPIGFTTNNNKTLLNGESSLIPAKKDSLKSEELDRNREKEELKKMGDKIISELQNNPEFADLAGQIKIEIVDEGLRIEMMDSGDDVFFEIGTSKLKPQAIKLLNTIGNELSKLPNKIVIEGHTDARPYNGSNKSYSNFELSCDRANAARRALIESSLQLSQIDEIRGYADRRLRDKADPYNLVNRRISIIVRYLR